MINKIEIRRFKSINSLSIICKKVNVFIGEPDTGKTNILEALQFISCLGWGVPINSLRLSAEVGFSDLFFRNYLDQPITISFDNYNLEAQLLQKMILRINGSVSFHVKPFDLFFEHGVTIKELQFIRHYLYAGIQHWTYNTNPALNKIIAVPFGGNLFYITRHIEKIYDLLSDIVNDAGFKVRFDSNLNKFFLLEERRGRFFEYNIDLLSDSSKRLFFYGAILKTTENATLILDEPDVWAFPPYPKLLGEMIADDKTNQFFLTTHNPYFLSAIVEKTDKDKLAIFICSRNPDGSTNAILLNTQQIQKIIELGANVFFNLDKLTEK